ncbi:hypothetical protein LWI29_026811 [Acer saccharum]|uniref:Uncharacterized protein n=1 Tax=Acer saccharum TaxID=4024 RepID=A0AA39RJT2_ACESA|nr:hypothetical protein LWI29_026811 [Acer saccharum]
MMETLGFPTVVGEKCHQEVQIPWSDEVREIDSDNQYMDVMNEFELKNVNKIHLIINFIPLKTIFSEQPELHPNSNKNSNTQPNLHPTQDQSPVPTQQPNLQPSDIVCVESSPVPSYCNTDKEAHTETDWAPTDTDWALTDIDGAYSDYSNGDQSDDLDGVHSDGMDGLFDINGSGVNEEKVVQINSDNECEGYRPSGGHAFVLGDDGRIKLENLLSTFKIDYLKDLFWPTAVSTNVAEFVKKKGDIKNASERAHQYLMDIPLELWYVHAFDTLTKIDHNTNNIVEAFNGWLNKYRKLPMLTMLETVRRKLMKRIHERFEAAMFWESNMPPTVNKKL